MHRVCTGRKMTPVTSEKIFWHQPIMQIFPCDAGWLGTDFSSPHFCPVKSPISFFIQKSSPWPTTIHTPFFMGTPRDLLPKPYLFISSAPRIIARTCAKKLGEVMGAKLSATVLALTEKARIQLAVQSSLGGVFPRHNHSSGDGVLGYGVCGSSTEDARFGLQTLAADMSIADMHHLCSAKGGKA